MIRERDVNSAMLQQAADELEIAVPIRSWHVRDGALVLRLAYGGEAVWTLQGNGGAGDAGPSGVPWRFVAELRDDDPTPIPGGDLEKIRKPVLGNILDSWGYQTETLRPLKAEYVQALEWARENLV